MEFHVFLMKLDQSLSSCSFVFQKSSFRIGRPQLSCILHNSKISVTMLNIVVHLESVRVTFHNFFDVPLGVIRILDQTRP